MMSKTMRVFSILLLTLLLVNFSSEIFTVANADTKNCVITYNANGGAGAPGKQTKPIKSCITLSETKPKRNGFQFLGWSLNKSAIVADYAPGDDYSGGESITLYAVWVNGASLTANNFIKVSSISANAKNVTIVFKVPVDIPMGYKLIVGFELPDSKYMKLQPITTAGISKRGTYTKIFGLYGYIGDVRVYATLSNNTLLNKKTVLGTYFDKPDEKTVKHEVTQRDVTEKKVQELVADGFWLSIGVGTTIVSGGVSATISWVANGFSLGMIVSDSFNDAPALAVRQYYVTRIYYEGYKRYTVLKIYASKLDYDKGKSPIYTRTTKAMVPHF